MKVNFSENNWKEVEKNWSLFWEGKMNRAMVSLIIADPSIPQMQGFNRFFPHYPSDWSINRIMEVETHEMSRFHFFGDAFPKKFLNFGPGSMATYMGSRPESTEQSVWFHPINKPIDEIKIHADMNSKYAVRVNDILDACLAAMGDQVQISFSDIGGNLDLLAALRGTEELLMDLVDNPDIVERLSKEITSEWLRVYDAETVKIKKHCRGFAAWSPAFSKDPCYMMQCDVSYMFSTEMFDRFVVPDIEKCCERIPASMYHLDGKGALKHLDSLLAIRKLKLIQWIPGAGQPESSEWTEVLDGIRNSGKLCELHITPEAALKLKSERDLSGFLINVLPPKDMTLESAKRLVDDLMS